MIGPLHLRGHVVPSIGASEERKIVVPLEGGLTSPPKGGTSIFGPHLRGTKKNLKLFFLLASLANFFSSTPNIYFEWRHWYWVLGCGIMVCVIPDSDFSRQIRIFLLTKLIVWVGRIGFPPPQWSWLCYASALASYILCSLSSEVMWYAELLQKHHIFMNSDGRIPKHQEKGISI